MYTCVNIKCVKITCILGVECYMSQKAWSKRMAVTVRLNDSEQERLRRKAIELNKVLINRGLEPIKDSELVHRILDQAIESAEVSSSGEVIIVLK